MPKEKQEEEQQEKKERYELTDIATETAPVIRDNETEAVYNELTILCRLANDIAAIKKNIIG